MAGEPYHWTASQMEKRRIFCDALRAGLSAKAAAREAGVSRSTAYSWRQQSEDFAKAWDDAYEAGSDELEDVAAQRAKGWQRPVYDGKGNVTGYEHAYSDSLLIFLLKGRRPSKYAPRPDQVPVNLTVILQQIANHSRCLPGDGAQDITPTPGLLEAGDDTLDIE